VNHPSHRYEIVLARARDLSQIAPIELAAARLLAGHAPEAVLKEVTSDEDLQAAQHGGRLWVALSSDLPVGFAHVELLEPNAAHLEEMDVDPEHGRRGIGSQLVRTVCRWAETRGLGGVTLTTFRDVPWNMPFYARLGFEEVTAPTLTPALQAVLEDEARRGFDPTRRLVMRWRSPAIASRVRRARPEDHEAIVALWERSVRATHHFLAEQDVAALRPLVADELASDAIDWWVLESTAGTLLGFLGFANDRIEGLFIDPDHRGQRGGSALVAHAQRLAGSSLVVDVNEQNQDAVGFYAALGFSVVGRSPTDESGRPFPILHMTRGRPTVEQAAENYSA
jgi:putative acetyltransferase